MNTRSMRISGLVFIVLMLLAAGCGAQVEPQVAPTLAVVQETVVVVVTATEVPPTPTPEVVFVVVTATNEPGAPVEEKEVVVEATAVPTETPEPEPEVEETAEEVEADEAEAESSAVQEVAVEMSLSSQKTTTQHSPRPDPFVEPASVEDLLPPNNWTDIQPNQSSEFKSYDGIRVLDGGEALLDLGNLMRLVLKQDSEIQTVPGDLVQEELSRISVDFQKSPMLQQVVLAAHLFRGGFLGEKTVGAEPVALTTPNAVVLISGTTFFLVYDPDDNVSYIGNFEGTIDVADVALQEGEGLPNRQILTIPPVRGRKNWPLHPHMTRDEFARLIDLEESPIDAVDIISGPYLRVKFSPELTVRNGPGTDFSYVGTISEGDYVRVIGRGRGWWEIECPDHLSASECWVSGGAAYVDEYNVDISPVPNTAPALPPTVTPTMTPTPKAVTVTITPAAPAPPGTSPGDVVNCRYIGYDKFEWYTAIGEGPLTGIWQSGCPVEPKVSIRGCQVSWEAYNDSVVSATIRIKRSYYPYYSTAAANPETLEQGQLLASLPPSGYDRTEEEEQFAASLPSGSSHVGLPSQFYEAYVEVYFDVTLFNGVTETKMDSKMWEYDDDNIPGC